MSGGLLNIQLWDSLFICKEKVYSPPLYLCKHVYYEGDAVARLPAGGHGLGDVDWGELPVQEGDYWSWHGLQGWLYWH